MICLFLKWKFYAYIYCFSNRFAGVPALHQSGWLSAVFPCKREDFSRQQHLLFHRKKDIQKHLGIEGGFEHQFLFADTTVFSFFNQRQGCFAQNIHVQRRVVLSRPRSILAEYHIKIPMKLVFNGPMLPHRIRKVPDGDRGRHGNSIYF